MGELLPILFGLFAGCMLALLPSRSSRALSGAAAIVITGLAATLASGEYSISWVFLVADLGEAAAGFTAGVVAARFASRIRWHFLSSSLVR
jgi:hypothetical protein